MIIARLRFSYVVMVSDSLRDTLIVGLYCFSNKTSIAITFSFLDWLYLLNISNGDLCVVIIYGSTIRCIALTVPIECLLLLLISVENGMALPVAGLNINLLRRLISR